MTGTRPVPQRKMLVEQIPDNDVLSLPASAAAADNLALGMDDGVGMAGITASAPRDERFGLELRSRALPDRGIDDAQFFRRVRVQLALTVPTVQDRVVQAALLNVLEPIFERDFAEQSYGFRPNRGCKDALRRVRALLEAGHTWVVDADLKSYFDTIPHGQMVRRVEEKVSDGRVIEMLQLYLKQDVMDGMESWTPKGGPPKGQ